MSTPALPFARGSKNVKATTNSNRKKSIKEIREEIIKKATAPPSLVAMHSETQTVKDIDDRDRAGRINVAVELVMADVKALQGQKTARLVAATLNSDKMKNHIGRICDEATHRRNDGAGPSTTRSSKPKSQPTSEGGANQVPGSAPPATATAGLQKMPKTGKQRKVSTDVNTRQPNSKATKIDPMEVIKMKPATVSGKSKSLGEILSEVAATLQTRTIQNTVSSSNPPTVQDTKLLMSKSKPETKTASQSGGSKKRSIALTTKNVGKAQLVAVPKKELFQTSIDLRGYTDDNISLDLDGRRLIVVAYRPKDKINHARKVTEIIEIPENVVVDNLKVARTAEGSLTIQEMLPA